MSSPARPRAGRERGYRRALGVGLAVSCLLHALVLILAGRVEVERPSPPPPPLAEEAPEGLLLLLLPPPPEEPETGTAPSRTPPAEAPRLRAPAADRTGLPAAEPVSVGERFTNADRLRPRLGDERLWVDFRDPIQPRSVTSDRYAEALDRLREVVRVWLDSLQLSEEQRRRAVDWTVGEGETRWGISPEGLHLGKITIPIPFGSLLQQGGPLGRQAEQAIRDLQAIRAQDARQAVEEAIEERREEMRRRSREEAERRGRDTTPGRP